MLDNNLINQGAIAKCVSRFEQQTTTYGELDVTNVSQQRECIMWPHDETAI